MAAAYAALVSLNHLIEQSMVHNARRSIFLDQQQRQMESLQQKVSFLQDFLEVYSVSNEARDLESRVADAAYAAEDIIESYVVDKITLESSSNDFSQDLNKVIEDIDCITKEIIGKSRVEDQQPRDQLPIVLSSTLPNDQKATSLEYYSDDVEQIMDKLTGQSSNLQIIPIVGMGGIGKTTLARNVYDNPLIVECFYIRAWVTISQEYNLREMLCGLLHKTGASYDKGEKDSEYHQLGERLHKHLSGRKYLIVMDDIWSIDALEKLKLFLPNYNNGSRIIITTRLLDVADTFGSSSLYKMNLLDENKSWSLLRKKLFGHDGNCPPELEEVGKNIAKNCKGLPLSIVVIGGLLAKSEMTQSYWEYVSKDINPIVNSEDNGNWLKVLYLSYNHLPIHLKPCFLYIGIHPEDREIHVPTLIKLWVAERILKPNEAKTLEEVAQDYLKDLIERNLIVVRKWGSLGKLKTCSIHDLLRDLCLKEAQKERFFYVVKPHNHAVNNERRIVFHEGWSHKIESHPFDPALHSKPLIRSLICTYFQWNSSWASVHNLRLLRVVTNSNTHNLENMLQLVNLRYLKCGLIRNATAVLSSLCRVWYLQILILTGDVFEINAPNEIWEMTQLRHIISKNGIYLPNPSCNQIHGQDDSALKSLQTLSWILNFKCTDEVLKRIPNIKKLSIDLYPKVETGMTPYCLHNLGHLNKLQALSCRSMEFFQNLEFPKSLKKLSLCFCYFDWNNMTEKVGSLPNLEKLKLDDCEAGAEWNTVEGNFLRLKFLEITFWRDLVSWTAESSHFPVLECLVLQEVTGLKEIPSGIGDTLQSIELLLCGSSVIASANEILEEQQSLGNEDFRLIVHGSKN